MGGIRVAPTYFSTNLHSNSNKMASIYKQPIVGNLRKKYAPSKFGSHNFNSMTTNDQTNIQNSMNMNGL